jgi:hypothetical protein
MTDQMANNFLLTAEEHRRRAARLRQESSEETLRIAIGHENAAMMIEKRLNCQQVAPPIAPR